MRVPNAGLDLIERRIVREGKALAERMLANFDAPRGQTLWQVYRDTFAHVAATLRGFATRSW